MLLKTDDRTRIRLDFEEWLERQPANKRYPWHNSFQCACGQYIDYIKDRDGYPRLRLVDRFRGVRRAPHPDEHHVWDMFNFLAQGNGTKKDQTFGALLERASKQCRLASDAARDDQHPLFLLHNTSAATKATTTRMTTEIIQSYSATACSRSARAQAISHEQSLRPLSCPLRPRRRRRHAAA
jgi:hypothetical protein